LSSLYLAALLAKVGRKVLVLEQHYIAGGCTHTFKDKGFEFDTGVHYVGQATQFTAFMDFAAGQEGAFKMQRQGAEDGSEVYNHLYFGGKLLHKYRPGPKTFMQDLIDKFPHEEKAIRKLMVEVEKAGAGMLLSMARQMMPVWLWKALMALPTPQRYLINKYGRTSFDDGLAKCGIKDPELRAILIAEFGDHGVIPEKVSFFLQAGIVGHYMAEGGFSVIGGSERFAEVLVSSITQGGGAVLVRAPVDKILFENGRAVGVAMANKKGEIRAKRSVISGAGAEVTYKKLIDPSMLEQLGGLPEPINETAREPVAEHIYGFIGFDESNEALELPSYNLWNFPKGAGADPSLAWQSLFAREGEALPDGLKSDEAATAWELPSLISFPSAKDPTYKDRCPGKSSCVIISEAKASFFGTPGPANKRGDEYAKIKKRYEMALLNTLFLHFPRLKGKVSYVDVGTPFSNDHYLGRTQSYGLTQSVDRFLDTTLRITVPGVQQLYLTGQDVVSGGIFPQIFAAWMTFGHVMGPFSPDFWILFWDFAKTVVKRSIFDKTYTPKLP